MQDCFHCGSGINPELKPLWIEKDNHPQPVCCLGCKAVAEHILSGGLANYYEFRSELAAKPQESLNLDDFIIYENPDYLSLIADENNDVHSISLSVENIHCAACAWLIENAVNDLPGIIKLNVNTISQRAKLEWSNSEVKLSSIIRRFAEIGYPASPFKESDLEVTLKQQEKQYVKRLGVAGLFTMQIMMVAVAMYFGAFESMESHQVAYFKWLSFLLSMPVILYSAVPFATGAIKAIKAKTLNMDVPVSVAIYGAFATSLFQLIQNGMDGNKGEVFFESISMFTFLLLVGKYLEFRAKTKAILSNANLSSTLPSTVNVETDGEQTQVLLKDVYVGQTVIVKAGEKIPVDGQIIYGQTQVNESLLTGEFSPVSKTTNDIVLAGSINADGFIKINVTAIGVDTALAEINRLQETFSDFKPKYSQLADKVAHWFVLAQLVVSALTYWYWAVTSPDDALWIALSVLVATCPCALSLATPTAYTCVLSTLSKAGVLIKDAIAFDRINNIDTIIFDKTGTLTQGKFSIKDIDWSSKKGDSFTSNEILYLIYQLERHSEHPISKAFDKDSMQKISNGSLDFSPDIHQHLNCSDIEVHAGLGISMVVNGNEFKVGSAEYVGCETSTYNVYCTVNKQLAVRFKLSDQLRDDAERTLLSLSGMNKTLICLTGDSSETAVNALKDLPLKQVKTACTPKQKALEINALQNNNHKPLMMGDGINDAPVLAAADVSVAMGTGADVTKQAANIILVNNSLNALLKLFENAARTRRIIKQNLFWALIYNGTILPIAMLGLVPPYIAVIGMSLSSIIVVSNSLRLLK